MSPSDTLGCQCLQSLSKSIRTMNIFTMLTRANTTVALMPEQSPIIKDAKVQYLLRMWMQKYSRNATNLNAAAF